MNIAAIIAIVLAGLATGELVQSGPWNFKRAVTVAFGFAAALFFWMIR